MEPFSISFSPQSLSAIAQLGGFQTLLSEQVQAAMQEAGSILVASVQGAMNWQNPTGALEESITAQSPSPYEVIIGSDLPYARRRDWGFVGTDSLGRHYNDVGAFYMETGFANAESQVLLLIESAAQNVLDALSA